MKLKNLSLSICLLIIATASAQYTEVINSNRPGESQGAFSVGTNVVQLELVPFFGKEKHKLLNTESSTWGTDFSLRYGLIWEQLELSWIGSFKSETRDFLGGVNATDKFANFTQNTLGAKFLLYDPYKNKEEKVNLYSYHANKKFKWSSLIPAVSIYAGANFVFTDSPFSFPDEPAISPRIVISTQNNWVGGWVFVTNLYADKFTTDFPTYGGILTMTHSLTEEWAVFGEVEVFKSDFYSDDIFRAGAAYLFTDDFQIDASVAANFKDTPSLFQVNLGLSYRLDFHGEDDDEMLKDDDAGKTQKKQKRKDEIQPDDDGGRL